MKMLLVVIPVALLGLTAVNLTARALWPDHVTKSRQTLERFPLRSFLVGVLVLLAEVWLVLTLPAKGLLLLTCATLDLVWLAQGLPAVAERIGQGLSLRDRAATAGGTALLGLVWGLPVLGWLAGAGLGLSALGAPLAGER